MQKRVLVTEREKMPEIDHVHMKVLGDPEPELEVLETEQDPKPEPKKENNNTWIWIAVLMLVLIVGFMMLNNMRKNG